MSEVTIRELRNKGGDVLDRVVKGEALIVTRDGRAIAELRPLPPSPLNAGTLIERWRRLPHVDSERLRADIDRTLNSTL